MRGWGVTLVILGIGSFILPLMGVQFRIMQIFGDYQWAGGLGLAVVGGLMAVVGRPSDGQ